MADADDRPDLHCRHFLLCHTIWFDVNRPERGFSLGRVLVTVAPNDGGTFPVTFDRLFCYGQFHGDPGEYSIRVRLVRIERDEYGEEDEVHFGDDGEPREFASRAIELFPTTSSWNGLRC